MVEDKDKLNSTNADDLDEQHVEELRAAAGEVQKVIHIDGLYRNWFLDYASYVILERAVPHLEDGLKPVQRRILHAMHVIDDGRFNKVANVIGQTMQYHPHGDASIGDALVQVGQKELLFDMQGNWGNILTGDRAAAARYIEVRLSKFALDVLFNAKTTVWQLTYDGRKKEPVTLPVKFPLLLASGVEGIAVGLASKILPHNFNELIDASIDYLKGKETDIYPDFQSGGLVDVTRYNDGLRGGKVRVRARINQVDKKMLVITEVPFGTTTTSLIESILAANEKGKIKIKKIEDNTAEFVEILIHLVPGISPDVTIDALYAFTDCEVSISPNSCVIENNKPRFLCMKEMLAISTKRTLELLRQELLIQKAELEEAWHFASLEKIFIEKEIYYTIRKCETWEAVLQTIDGGLKPFKKKFKRAITTEDIIRLTEIRIKRISKYDAFKADKVVEDIELNIQEVQNHLDNMIDFAVNYFKQIKKKYGKDKDRKTEIRSFDTIEASMVAAINEKLYFNREEGFAGTGLKKDEFISDCSDIDDIIVFRENGTCTVSKVGDKVFVGNNVIYINIYKKNDERTVYNLVYRDGPSGGNFVKRFAVVGVTRDKDYDLTKGTPGSKVLYFTANPNGEAEVITIKLRPRPHLKKLSFDFNFTSIAIKGRNAIGNVLSKHYVSKILLRDEGVSTLSARKIWYDEIVRRLNAEERGVLLGDFIGDDRILSIMQSGNYKLSNYDLANHFDEDMLIIKKYRTSDVVTAIYLDGPTGHYFVKRFNIEMSDKKMLFIPEDPNSKLEFVSIDKYPRVELITKDKKGTKSDPIEINLEEFITVKGVKAKGNRLSQSVISKIKPLDPLPFDEPIEIEGFDEIDEEYGDIDTTLIPPPPLDANQTKLEF